MLEIGELKTVPVLKGFGKNAVRVTDADGEVVTRQVPTETWRVTRGKLDGHFCRDKNRRLIIGLLNGDVLSLRPEGRTKRTSEVTVTLQDVYSYCLRNRALKHQLEKARTRKAKLADIRSRRRIADADRRMTQRAKEGK